MKTIISPEPGKVCLGDIPVPTPGPYEALVKIEACAICNHTDMMFVNREFGGPEGGGFLQNSAGENFCRMRRCEF